MLRLWSGCALVASLFLGACATTDGHIDFIPNWRIEQIQIDADRYRIAMRKKPFSTGGDGEAIQVFMRRAGELTREAGAAGYRVVEYTEGVESGVPLAQRVAQGVVEFIR